MKGPPITVKCDCGNSSHVPYGEAWTCERCGRSWDTTQIPSEEYWGIMREMRQYRMQAMMFAVIIAVVFAAVAIATGPRAFALTPIIIGFWFLWYMPQWRRKVRAAARNVPRWKLTPE